MARLSRFSPRLKPGVSGTATYFSAAHPLRCLAVIRRAMAHRRAMVIDGETVVTGSCSFTKAAEEGNAENLLAREDHRTCGLQGPDGPPR